MVEVLDTLPASAEMTEDGLRLGVDLVVVADVARSVDCLGDRYLTRLFTEEELAYCRGPRGVRVDSLAARFAAKEAVLKVLRPTGGRPQWRDIEVCRQPDGWCEVRLHGEAARLARARGVDRVSVSLSHEGGVAVAVAAGLARSPGWPPEGGVPAGAPLHEPTSDKDPRREP